MMELKTDCDILQINVETFKSVCGLCSRSHSKLKHKRVLTLSANESLSPFIIYTFWNFRSECLEGDGDFYEQNISYLSLRN